MADTPRVAAPLQHGKMESLSGTTDDRGIKITQTATAGDTIHLNSSGNTQLIYLWLSSTHSSAIVTSLECGGATSPDDVMEVSVAADAIGEVSGFPLGAGKTLKIFAATANKVSVRGYAVSIG